MTIDFLNMNSGAKVDIPGQTPGGTGTEPGSAAPAADAGAADPGLEPPAGQQQQQPAPGEGARSQAGAPASDPDFETRLSTALAEASGGAIKTPDDVKAVLQRLAEVEQKQPSLEFPSEKAKKAYEYIMKMPGDDAFQSMQRYFGVLELPADKLEPKELMFEGFMLREENADLTRERGRKIFEAEYAEDFPEGFQEDERLNRRHELAVREAAGAIKKIQEDYAQAKGAFNEDIGVLNEDEVRDYKRQIDEAAATLKEIKVAVGKDVNFNVLLDDPKEIESLKEYAFDPRPMWDKIIETYDKGETYDVGGLMQRLALINNPDKFLKLAFDQGKEEGKLEKLNEFQNTGQRREQAAGAIPTFDDKFRKAWIAAEQGTNQ